MPFKTIKDESEFVDQLITGLADAFHEKRWTKILSIFLVVIVLFLNPIALDYELLFLQFQRPYWYSYRLWLVITCSIFASAFLVALLAKKRRKLGTAPAETSIIKGLLPYSSGPKDSEWFANLQRGNIIQECLGFCLGAESSFAILSGESGSGKTSMLQAGLVPNLILQGHHPVYVRLTDSDPLVTIGRLLGADNESFSLIALLQKVIRKDQSPLVLILDQFEQFFAHNKTKSSRKLFIQQMAEWHKQRNTLPVKILISVRGDFADLLTEFHREMEYTLTAHNKLRLDKFEPDEATSVISFIARTANIGFDERFIEELTKHDLANREDGTVSPVDIQILSWMVGQKGSDERAFNRKAFQKLGGLEGLLQTFLERQLDARETAARRQAAIKVMLALINQDVLAGAMSLRDMKEKLAGVLSGRSVEEALSWLTKSEVRLITPVQEKHITRYELAHEKLIPPLRRIALKEISDVEVAQQTLDRRVNEWIGNDRSRRYLLTFTEWRLIKRNWQLLVSLKNEPKNEFFALSQRRLTILATIGLTTIVAALLTTAGIVSYRSYRAKPETQMYYAQEHFANLLKENRNTEAITDASLLLPILDGESNHALSEQIWQQIVDIQPDDRSGVLRPIAKEYGALGNDKATLARIDKIREAADQIDPLGKAQVFLSLVEAYRELPKTEKALSGLTKVEQGMEGLWRVTSSLDPSEHAEILVLLSAAYSKEPNSLWASDGLGRIQTALPQFDLFHRSGVLAALAKAYKTLAKSNVETANVRTVREEADKILQLADRLDSRDKSLVLSELSKVYSELGYIPKSMEALKAIERATKTLKLVSQPTLLVALTVAYSNLRDSNEALLGLDRVRGMSDTLGTDERSNVLAAVSDGYRRIGVARGVIEGLDKVFEAARRLDSDGEDEVLIALARAYGALIGFDGAILGLAKIQREMENYIQMAGSLDRFYQGGVLRALGDAYSKASQLDEAKSGLSQIELAAEKVVPPHQATVFISLAKAYHRFGQTELALRNVIRAQKSAEAAEPNDKAGVLVEVSVIYAQLREWTIALKVAESIGNESEIAALSRIFVIWADAKNSTKYMKALDEADNTDS